MEHALHNELLCDHLLEQGTYYDWVLTTAFYSALHFVNHQLFPFTYNGNSYANFDLYYDAEIINKKGPKMSKHAATIDLVSNHLIACYSPYKNLYDMCMTSRYNNYHVTKAKASKARSYLSAVKNCCSK